MLQEPDFTASIAKECVGHERIVHRRDFETLQSVTSQPSEQGAKIELGEIQPIEIGAESEVSIQTVVGKVASAGTLTIAMVRIRSRPPSGTGTSGLQQIPAAARGVRLSTCAAAR